MPTAAHRRRTMFAAGAAALVLAAAVAGPAHGVARSAVALDDEVDEQGEKRRYTPPPPSATTARKRQLEVASHVGGAHHRTIIHGGRWLQTFSNQLLVLSPSSGAVEAKIELAPFGATGPAVDAALLPAAGSTASTRLLVVLDRSAVADIDLVDPAQPRVTSLTPASQLGIRPMRVSVVDGEAYIGGEGGVVRWSDRAHFLRQGLPAAAGAVVGGPASPVACVGRRVFSLADGGFVGAATELLALPAGASAPLAFALQGPEAATVGLMGLDIREKSSVVVPGTVRRLRWFDDRLWIVTDTEIVSYGLAETRLAGRQSFRVKGARDVDLVSQNILAVAGSFGRALYRRVAEGELPGDTFFGARREASGLERALTDNRRILAGGDEGFWLYLIGDTAALSDRVVSVAQQPPSSVAGPWGTAEVAEDARAVKIVLDGVPQEFRPDGNPVVWCLATVDNALWIGHELGITVIGRGESGLATSVGTIRLDGPVRYLFPKWDAGMTYVAELGGFGVARLFDKPAPTDAAAAAKTADGRDRGATKDDR